MDGIQLTKERKSTGIILLKLDTDTLYSFFFIKKISWNEANIKFFLQEVMSV